MVPIWDHNQSRCGGNKAMNGPNERNPRVYSGSINTTTISAVILDFYKPDCT